jgi:hypothetical protein
MDYGYLLKSKTDRGLIVPDFGKFFGPLFYIPDTIIAYRDYAWEDFGDIMDGTFECTSYIDDLRDVRVVSDFLGRSDRALVDRIKKTSWSVVVKIGVPEVAIESYKVARDVAGHDFLEYWQNQERGFSSNLLDFVEDVFSDFKR